MSNILPTPPPAPVYNLPLIPHPSPQIVNLPQSPIKPSLPQIPLSPILPPQSPPPSPPPSSPNISQLSQTPTTPISPQSPQSQLSIDQSLSIDIMDRINRLQIEMLNVDFKLTPIEAQLQELELFVNEFENTQDLSIKSNSDFLNESRKSISELRESLLNSTQSAEATTVSDISAQLEDVQLNEGSIIDYPAPDFISIEDDINNSTDLTEEEKKIELENIIKAEEINIAKDIEKEEQEEKKEEEEQLESENIVINPEPQEESKSKYEMASQKMRDSILKLITQYEIKNKIMDTKRRQEWGITSKILPSQVPPSVKVTRSKTKSVGNEKFQKLQNYEKSNITSKIQREERTHGTRSSLRDEYGITEDDLPMVFDKPQVKNKYKPTKKKK